ncbi:MAG: hypothetical protein ACLFRT_14775 [Actinomycetota bacterium]
MIAELAIAGVLAVTGLALLVALRGDFGGAVPWMAFPIGVAVYLLAALSLLVIAGTFDPKTGLVVTGAVGAGGLVISLSRRNWNTKTLLAALAVLGVTAVTVLVARTVHLTRLTPDSLRYLLFAGEMQLPDAFNEIHPPDLVNRQMGLPSLHAMSSLTDRRYLASIGPLFGVSGFGFFIWLCWRATVDLIRSRRWILVGTAVLFLLSSNRLVYDAFYINTHIEVALYLLVTIAGSWIAVTERDWRWAVPAGIALGATLLFRPEAPIVATIVLVAVAASDAGWQVRLAMTAPTVLVAALWYGVVLWQNAPGGDAISPTAPVFGSLVAVFVAALVVTAGGSKRLWVMVRHMDRVMLAVMLVALAGFAAANLDVFTASVEASFQNIALSQGAWLFTWSIGVVLLAVALVVHQVPSSRLWTTPILGFAILWWLLPIIREGAWRVGTGDSGNRILAHMLAVVVVFLVLAAIPSWPWVGSKSGVEEVTADTA